MALRRPPRSVPALLFLALAVPTAGQDCVLPPSPQPILQRQPDGTVLELRMRGDAFGHWYEDPRGYPALMVGSAAYFARVGRDGVLRPTAHLAGSVEPESLGVRRLSAPPIAPGLRGPAPASSGPGAKGRPDHPRGFVPAARVGGGSAAGSAAEGSAGSVKNLLLLLRFSDHGPGGQDRTLPSTGDVDTIMNAVGGDPALAPTGSVRDHYIEDSYGQLVIDTTVIGWLDVPDTEVYYANNNSGLTSLTWDLITAGLDLADPLVDFSQFDVDGDGWIDAITFLHSGYGAEWGGTDQYGTHYSDRMWSHKWSIPTWTSTEGVRVSEYNISPGLWATSGSAPGRIGVVCHELGHFFGLPDLYDTESPGQGIGNWCLMAAGSWGFDGSQQYPSHMSAWAKMKIGWIDPVHLMPGAHVAHLVELNPEVYWIQNGYPPTEYLLIENRQQAGFDAVIPQGGLAIWHADDTKGQLAWNDVNADQGYPGQSGWPGNGRHYRIALLQADGAYDMEQNQDRGDAQDPYHGGGVDSIDGLTMPSTDTYQGGVIVSTGNVISGVDNSGPSMGFDYANPLAPVIAAPGPLAAAPGVPYAHSLTASGGIGPLGWSELIESPSYAVVDLGTSLYAGGGTAQGWNADEAIWPLSLPFEFPFYHTTYDEVWVSSNGFLAFAPNEPEPSNRDAYLSAHLRIAPLWDDIRTDTGGSDDVYVDATVPGQVLIRWRGEHYDTGAQVRAAVTLFQDGRIRFDYGTGNDALSPTVGISRGAAADFIAPDGYSGATSLSGASSLEFQLGGSQMPPGLTLAADGTLSGIPTAPGTWTLMAKCEDSEYRYDVQPLSIDVALLDCNGNGVDDLVDVATGTSPDCNGTGVPDECELAGNDCDANGVPDECDADCNANGTPDACEGFADCNGTGVPDECELAGNDCDANGVPDECDADCDNDGIPDACESEPDCNGNGLPDSCELLGNDCNQNGVPDECDQDVDQNGVPDECEGVVGVPSCFGVGCTCANDDPTAGCANSTGGGAYLTGSGSTSVAANDLLLTATGVVSFNSGLFYMGSQPVQNAFFDGFQCALGTTFRFLTSIQVSGPSQTMTFFGPAGLAGGLIQPGTTWHFQCWYRDVPGTPCGSGSNLSNAFTVAFTP